MRFIFKVVLSLVGIFGGLLAIAGILNGNYAYAIILGIIAVVGMVVSKVMGRPTRERR